MMQMRAKNIAREKLSKEEFEFNENLLKQVDELFKDGCMHTSFEELEENLGYSYDEDTDTVRFRITKEKAEALESIKQGNLHRLKELNDNGHKFGHYCVINAKLACKYGHIDIIEYLINSKQLNRDLNAILAEVSNVDLLKKMYQRGYFNNNNNNNLEFNLSLLEYYKSLSILNISKILKINNQYSENSNLYFPQINHLEGVTESDIIFI